MDQRECLEQLLIKNGFFVIYRELGIMQRNEERKEKR